MLTSLILSSGTGCAVERGGCFYPVSKELPLILPAGENETAVFTVWGRMAGDLREIPIPRFVRIAIENGKAVSSDVPVINWGDVLEAEAEPLYVDVKPKIRPGILDALEASFGGERIRAELFYDNGLNIAYYRDGARPVSMAIGEGESGKLRVLDVGSARFIAVRAAVPEGKRLVLLDREGVSVLDETGTDADVIEGFPTVTEALPSVRGLLRRTRFAFSKGAFTGLPPETGFFGKDEHIPASDAERAVSIAEELRIGYEERWRGLVYADLSEALEGDALKRFLGEYDAVRPHPVEEREGRVTVGLISKNGLVMTPRKFLFVFEGGLLTDVEEL